MFLAPCRYCDLKCSLELYVFYKVLSVMLRLISDIFYIKTLTLTPHLNHSLTLLQLILTCMVRTPFGSLFDLVEPSYQKPFLMCG